MIKRYFLGVLLAAMVAGGTAQNSVPAVVGTHPSWYTALTSPNKMARPWTFWYWMYGAVSKEGIKADLQAMKDVGLGGCYLMPIRGAQERPEYQGEAQQLSPRFWEMIDYAMQQADSLGLELGIHICDGFALAGGPWIAPEESMQKVVWSETFATGQLKGLTLQRPQAYEGYYEDIATYAIPVARQDEFNLQVAADSENGKTRLTCSSTMTRNAKGVFSAAEPAWIQYDFLSPRTFRNIEIAANGTNMQAQRMTIEVSDDGKLFRVVKHLVPPRQGWQNYDYNTTFAFPVTTARYWRLSWTPEGTEPGSEDLDAAKWRPRLGLKNATLSNLPRIDNWEGKAGFAWRIAPETTAEELPDADCVRREDVVKLELDGDQVSTSFMANRPYRIIRMGHTSTGYTNATGGGGKGLECDKFSQAAVNRQIDHWFARFAERQPSGKPVKYLHVDSWECGCQNWSSGFAAAFRQRRGYDLMSLLPVMAGIPMESAEMSEQVLRDVRLTINDLIHEVFFATVQKRAHDMGMLFSSESIAPTMVSDGLLHYRYSDIPMGEYWLNSPTHDKPNDMLDAISGAHIYGKNIVQAEGFTEVRGVWNETPAMVKPLLDRNFALGMNRLFFHVFTHNPWTDRKPGMTLDGIGLFFQRDQTWFSEAKAFVNYITRCQKLLQWGRPVADIAVYTGEEMPSRALTPDRLVPMLPGLFGKGRVESEHRRLANVGQPMEESPVGVHHSAGILDMKDWINPLHGYLYDSMNKDALLHQPFSYRVLVVPEGCRVGEEAKAKIAALRQQGIMVIDKPYHDETLKGVPRDVELSRGLAFTHRRNGNTDIYFIANQTGEQRIGRMVFNVSGKKAALYNPQSNSIIAVKPVNHNGQQIINYSFPKGGSVFVIFSDSLTAMKEVRPVAEIQTNNISSPWAIEFKENGKVLRNCQLSDWTANADDQVKYYSGRARYATTFSHKPRKPKVPRGELASVVLQLGEVCDVAHVWLNGIDCGIAWTSPYEVDISKAIRKGKNKLEIDVVNTWHNALKGADIGRPPYEGIWTNAKYRTKGDSLLPAGLIGITDGNLENGRAVIRIVEKFRQKTKKNK